MYGYERKAPRFEPILIPTYHESGNTSEIRITEKESESAPEGELFPNTISSDNKSQIHLDGINLSKDTTFGVSKIIMVYVVFVRKSVLIFFRHGGVLRAPYGNMSDERLRSWE